MRPKFILIIMIITLGFLLILMISPGFWHRKQIGGAVVVRYRNPTAENVQALKLEQAKAKNEQYLVCSLVVLNVISFIIYGALQQRKGML